MINIYKHGLFYSMEFFQVYRHSFTLDECRNRNFLPFGFLHVAMGKKLFLTPFLNLRSSKVIKNKRSVIPNRCKIFLNLETAHNLCKAALNILWLFLKYDITFCLRHWCGNTMEKEYTTNHCDKLYLYDVTIHVFTNNKSYILEFITRPVDRYLFRLYVDIWIEDFLFIFYHKKIMFNLTKLFIFFQFLVQFVCRENFEKISEISNEKLIFAHTVRIYKMCMVFLLNFYSICFFFQNTSQLCRSGDRNKISSYPNDMYKSEKKWNGGYGQLTNVNLKMNEVNVAHLIEIFVLIAVWKTSTIWIGPIFSWTICKSHWKWRIFTKNSLHWINGESRDSH